MKSWVLYIVLLAVGIAAGLGSRSIVSSEQDAEAPEATAEHSADDGHGHDTADSTAVDWCAEHRVPESQCTQCNSALIAEFKAKNDWCGEHGVPESHCRLCDPDIRFPQESALEGSKVASTVDWCAEHRVPESQCTQCNSALIAEFKAKNDWCGEHGVPESHCRLCNSDIHFPQEPLETVSMIEPIQTSVFYPANVVDCATNNSIIQFASFETATRAGLSVEPVLNADGEAYVEAPAEIRFDNTKTTTLTITVPVLVARWFVEPGERIFAGQKLAELESPDIAKLQAEYLEASARHTVSTQELGRARSLRARDLLSQSEYEKLEADSRAAEAVFAGVRGLLVTAGFAEADCEDLLESKRVSQRYTLHATSNGLLVERRAPVGELLEAGSPLAMIGDPSEVWIEAQVRERDLAEIKEGQAVEFSIDGNAIERVAGRVIWVAQYLDPQSRTGTVRAKLLSAQGGVKANLFGRAKIHTSDENTLSVVSRDAVQWEGCCNVVFVREAVDRYRPRKVTIARGDNDHYRVLSGVAPGEMVVIDGSYLLKTELKKGSIGAGCCGLEAK